MHAKRGSSWKLWFIIIALVVVIAILGILCVRYLLNGDGFDLFGSSSSATVDSSLSTQVAAQDANGKNVTEKISVTAGTQRPDIADVNAELTLLNIDWAGKKDASFPMILTVSDQTFPNSDGLAVYHYANGLWELLGTYLIENHSVSFQTDSLSPFAFEVISSKPEPTATPAPTDTPAPTETPEPTPEPIDYGKYDAVQAGEFVQVDSLTVDGAYVIALIDTETTQNSEQSDSTVTLFDAVQSGTLTATVLVNYDGTKLSGIELEITKGSDGRYTISDTVTEGMLWTAVTSEYYGDGNRFSLRNNAKFLNLDDSSKQIILNDNEVRTRWLAQTVTPDGSSKGFPSLTYRVDSTTYYIKSFLSTESADDEGTSTSTSFSAIVSSDDADAKQIVLFQLRTAIPTTSPENTGLTILTNTPSAIEGLDATPQPTSTPDDSGTLTPVTPTAPPSAPTPTAPTVATDPPEITMTPNPADDEADSSTDADSGDDSGDDSDDDDSYADSSSDANS